MSIDHDPSDENHQRAIEFLAQESREPIDVVSRLYKLERVRLEAGARVRAFISILTIRNVRRLLRQSGDMRARSRRSPAEGTPI